MTPGELTEAIHEAARSGESLRLDSAHLSALAVTLNGVVRKSFRDYRDLVDIHLTRAELQDLGLWLLGQALTPGADDVVSISSVQTEHALRMTVRCSANRAAELDSEAIRLHLAAPTATVVDDLAFDCHLEPTDGPAKAWAQRDLLVLTAEPAVVAGLGERLLNLGLYPTAPDPVLLALDDLAGAEPASEIRFWANDDPPQPPNPVAPVAPAASESAPSAAPSITDSLGLTADEWLQTDVGHFHTSPVGSIASPLAAAADLTISVGLTRGGLRPVVALSASRRELAAIGIWLVSANKPLHLESPSGARIETWPFSEPIQLDAHTVRVERTGVKEAIFEIEAATTTTGPSLTLQLRADIEDQHLHVDPLQSLLAPAGLRDRVGIHGSLGQLASVGHWIMEFAAADNGDATSTVTVRDIDLQLKLTHT